MKLPHVLLLAFTVLIATASYAQEEVRTFRAKELNNLLHVSSHIDCNSVVKNICNYYKYTKLKSKKCSRPFWTYTDSLFRPSGSASARTGMDEDSVVYLSADNKLYELRGTSKTRYLKSFTCSR